MKCDNIGCDNEATKKPIIVLKASKKAKPNQCATSDLGLFVCNDCSDYQAEDYLSDEGWLMIEENFQKAGLAKPIRKYTEVKYENLQ